MTATGRKLDDCLRGIRVAATVSIQATNMAKRFQLLYCPECGGLTYHEHKRDPDGGGKAEFTNALGKRAYKRTRECENVYKHQLSLTLDTYELTEHDVKAIELELEALRRFRDDAVSAIELLNATLAKIPKDPRVHPTS